MRKLRFTDGELEHLYHEAIDKTEFSVTLSDAWKSSAHLCLPSLRQDRMKLIAKAMFLRDLEAVLTCELSSVPLFINKDPAISFIAKYRLEKGK